MHAKVLSHELSAAVQDGASVVVRNGTHGVRCEGYLEEGTKTELRISPIRVDALGDPADELICVLPQRNLAFGFPGYQRVDDQTITLDIHAARTTTYPRRPRWEGSSCALFLPRGIDGVHLLPITSLSSSGCTVYTAKGLPVDRVYRDVEVLGREGLLRTSSAQVLENVPWCDSRGNRGYRTRLWLVPDEKSDSEASVISDPEQIDELLQVCVSLGIPGVIEPAFSGAVRFASQDQQSVTVQTEVDELGPRQVTLQFELWGAFYAYRARVLERKVGELRVSRPALVRIMGRRKHDRVDVREQRVEASVSHPLVGRLAHCKILDVSAEGLRMCVDRMDAPFWPGMPLRDLRLRVGGETHRLGRVGVIHKSDMDISLRLIDEAPAGFLRSVMELRRPHVTIHDGTNFGAHLHFFRRMRLMLPYMEELLDAHGEKTALGWRKCHSSGNIARTFCRTESDQVVASVSALQAWPGTWMAQHLAADPARTSISPGEMFLMVPEHVIAAPNFSRLWFATTRQNHRMLSVHRKFAAMTGTHEAMSMSDVDLWVARHTPRSPTDPRVSIRPLRTREKKRIANAATREYGAEIAAGLGLNADDIELRKLTKTYAAVGLERSRRIEVVLVDNTPTLCIIHEHTSRGACLSGLANATWILPLTRYRDEPGSRSNIALTSAIAALGREKHEPSRCVVVPASLPRQPMLEFGLEIGMELSMFVLNRSGLRRYLDFIKKKYGAGVNPKEAKRAAS